METVTELPQEIISDILCRLPVKHLIQLKCVSKPWKSLISDPQFTKLHLEAQSLNYRVLFLTRSDLTRSVNAKSAACEASADDLEDIESNMILDLQFPAAMRKSPESDELVDRWLVLEGSCNGLICVVFKHQRIFLWNPSLREAKELAELSYFDPEFTFNYGLGYDFSTDDYKIVRIACSEVSDATQIEVLTLKSNIWRRIQGLQPGIEIIGLKAGISFHGAVHWLAATNKTGAKTRGIVAFDMLEEKFHEPVPIPDQMEEREYDSIVLGISGDCLCLFFWCDDEYFLEAWLLKEYGIKSSWTRLFNVPKNIGDGSIYGDYALCYTKAGKVVLDTDGTALMWYDPKENTSKTFTPGDDMGWLWPVIYIETLVSPIRYSAANM